MSTTALNRHNLLEQTGSCVTAQVRIVHLGLGAFHRAHQAFYTAHAADAESWGIAAFTGRSAQMADALSAQDGLFALVERGPETDRVEVISSIVEAIDGARLDRLMQLMRDQNVAIVTLTVTEAGYRLSADGSVDLEDAVIAADLEDLKRNWAADKLHNAAPRASLTRLLLGLEARRRAGGFAVAIVPCDNLPENGPVTARALTALAAELDADLLSWLNESVSFVSTSVDRITPRVDEALDGVVGAAGWIDPTAVVTEPFRDWVLAGEFPAGRPSWETAGARFVDDVEPWENRKLWLLNGAHSILTYAGIVAGHRTIAEAVTDRQILSLVEEFWNEAASLIPSDVETVQYRRDLMERFRNARIVHTLDQIAVNGSLKVRVRLAAVAEQTLARGADPAASIDAVTTWVSWLLAGHTAADSRAPDVAAALASADPILALVTLVSPTLAADESIVDRIRQAMDNDNRLTRANVAHV